MRAAVLGALFAISLGILFVIRSPPDIALSRETEWNSVLVFLLLWSVPVAVALTVSASAAAARIAKTSATLRYCVYAVIALAVMTVAAPFWIKLVPFALGAAAVYMLGFERWLVRPHVKPAPKPRRRSRDALSDLEKGALLGASTALVIALVHALTGGTGRGCGVLLCPSFVDSAPPSPGQLFAVIAMHAVPVGILWGVLVGKIASLPIDESARGSDFSLAPVGRWLAVIGVGLFGICSFGVAWPELLPNSLGIGLVHCAVMLSWTRHDPVTAPVARMIDRPRSTCSRDARSTDQTPTRSDTSHTTRSA